MKRPLLSLTLALLTPAALLAQTPTLVVPFAGSQAFCHILQHFQLKPLPRLADLAEVKPEETLVVVFGDTEVLERLTLPDFLEAGGALLLASDRPDQGRLKPWQLSIDGTTVVVSNIGPNWPTLDGAYKGQEKCPLVVDGLRDPHPIFKSLGKGIATNCPSYVEVHQDNFPVLTGFPQNCFPSPWLESSGVLPQNLKLPFLVGSPGHAPPAGRVLIMAGHSVFMNGLMAQPDNDNFLFAWNCIRWLSEAPGANRQRKYVLFVDDGRIITNLNVPLALPPPPPVPPTVLINRLLRGLEEEHFFHRLLYHVFSGAQIGRFLLIAFSAGLLLVGARRWRRSHSRPDPAVPLTSIRQGPGRSLTTLLAHRHQAQQRLNNYRETAVALVQQFFLETVYASPQGHSFSSLIQQRGGPSGPLRPVSGSWWQRWRRRRLLRRLWDLAQGNTKGRITAKQLRRLLGQIAELQMATFVRARSVSEG